MNSEPDLYNSEDSPHWSATTIAVVAVLLLVLLIVAVFAFRIVIVPLVVGTIIAYVFRPVVRYLHQQWKLPRGIAAALVYVVLLAILIPTIILLTPPLVAQLQTLRLELIDVIRQINDLSPDSTIEIGGFEFNTGVLINELNSQLTNVARSLASQSLTMVRSVAQVLLMTVFTILISFYITRDAARFIQAFEDLVPRAYKRDARLLIREIDTVWGAFFRGQVILSLIVTVILTTVSAALGLPNPILLGIWGGLLEFLPSIGNVIWGATAVLLALLQGSTYLPLPNPTFAIVVVIAYVLFAQLDINILIPNVIGRHVRLHPVVVIIGVIIGIQVGGVLGVALAAPTIASLRVIGRYVYAKLFRMYPFPMVGPPSAPWQERLATIQPAPESTAPDDDASDS